jgi:hypothetical protein
MHIMKSWDAKRYAERYAIGLDIGQQNDFSALAVVSQQATQGAFDAEREAYRPVWQQHVVWLERWPLGTPFSSVVRRTVEIRNSPHLVEPGDRMLGRPTRYPPILLDSTGVGLPLVGMFRENHQVTPTPVTITGGDNVNTTATGYRVPKADLVGALSVGFEMQEIKIASGLDLSDDLIGELKAFRMETNSATGRTRYNAMEGAHDDLLIATALATWWLQRQRNHVVGFAKVVFG